MTAGDNGSKPEDDDPFGYLYADGQASGATPPSGGGGYGYPGPRSSYHQVRPVGERQYGGQQQQYAQQPPTAAYGQVPHQQQGGQYGQQAPYGQQGQYAQPGPGGPGHGGHGSHGGQGGGRGRGPNTKGILIGAVAVVAAVVVGIGIVVWNGNSEDDSAATGADSTPSASAEPGDDKDKETGKPTDEEADPDELPALDAKALKLEGGTSTASDVKGAKAAGGVYVTGFNSPGAAVTWTLDDLADAGKYTVYVGYGVPGKDADATLTVNGTPQSRPFSLKNFAGAPEGNAERGWTESFAYVQLNKGTNTLKLSCEDGNKCDVNLDRVWLAKGWKG
ncbi:carbohydrate-binding protein [Streptomyces sp. NPDC059578]|uniref:carbohydrate-binding protein n=1 Tax=Streptomyces sp. NPDC059578 TaxID=3346874 RepID=UPI0036A7C605